MPRHRMQCNKGAPLRPVVPMPQMFLSLTKIERHIRRLQRDLEDLRAHLYQEHDTLFENILFLSYDIDDY